MQRKNTEAEARLLTIPPFGSYNVCSWAAGERVLLLEGLSIDAARHIAQVHASMGEASRIHCEADGADYCESYCLHGSVRRGRFADVLLTARVVGQSGVGAYHAICCEAVIA